MSTQTDADKLRTARELREIRRLYGHLQQQATATGYRDAANNDAIGMLTPAADLTAWQNRYDTANHTAWETGDPDWHTRTGGKDYAVDQLEEHHPLLVLPYHEDRIREQLGTPTERRATVNDAALFLASSITWMYDDDLYGNPNYAAAKQLIRDLTACRTRLENILKDGIRHEPTETPCPEPDCHRRLVKIHGASVNLDYFRCPEHRQHIDYPTFVGITHQHLWSSSAENAWIDVAAAAKSTGRSKKTIITWTHPKPSTVVPFAGARIRYRRVGPMRRIEVYWPDVREADRDAKQRRRVVKKSA